MPPLRRVGPKMDSGVWVDSGLRMQLTGPKARLASQILRVNHAGAWRHGNLSGPDGARLNNDGFDNAGGMEVARRMHDHGETADQNHDLPCLGHGPSSGLT